MASLGLSKVDCSIRARLNFLAGIPMRLIIVAQYLPFSIPQRDADFEARR